MDIFKEERSTVGEGHFSEMSYDYIPVHTYKTFTMSIAKSEIGGVEAHVENATLEDDGEKVSLTAYTRDDMTSSHRNSPVERRLVLKADLVIVPLAALIYFAAYLVSN